LGFAIAERNEGGILPMVTITSLVSCYILQQLGFRLFQRFAASQLE